MEINSFEASSMKGQTTIEPYEVLTTKNVQQFFVAANDFIDLLEKDFSDIAYFIRNSRELLLRVYATALKLPEIKLQYSCKNQKLNEEKLYTDSNLALINKIGEAGLYHKIIDPYEKNDGAPTTGCLSCDFDIIYTEINTELHKIATGNIELIEDALWQLKFGFQNSWGNHCINALYALHYLLIKS
ncbi:MAG: DUF5063 domain-containing protein [Bacteroidales bacterium]|nr:DUF5063 domain-containing protein [Bacteroidales bacterium]